MPENKLIIFGSIVKGLGEGAFFMSMPHYKSEIKKTLGFDAYPGTLNIRIRELDADILKKFEPKQIKGTLKDNKLLGGAECYNASIKKIKGSIIVPHLTKHKKNIIEFIAPVHVRTELKIKDGDKVGVEIEQWQK